MPGTKLLLMSMFAPSRFASEAAFEPLKMSTMYVGLGRACRRSVAHQFARFFQTKLSVELIPLS